MFSKEVYKKLEAIVGPENISDELFVRDSYARRSGMAGGTKLFVPRYEAIVLPKETEEVQTIVKTCNEYEVPYKASSTGWGFFSDPAAPGAVLLDMRRMNRIIEIDEKSMYAVVEPYVVGAELQAALMKRGLISSTIGAGSNCSAHPLVGHVGGGPMGQTTSYAERNLLGVEWVTPDGEIYNLGSLGSLKEWFCGDGPGPSLRGVIRGCATPLGGIGVFTKAATKVYHWAGPSVFPVEGVSPRYTPRQIPDNFLVRYFSFPTFDRMIDAQQKIGESEIAFELMAFDKAMLASNIATCNDEDVALFKQLSDETQGPGFLLIIIGNCPEEFEYKSKVLKIIINETEGKSTPMIEDPKIGGGLMWRCIRITGSIRETFRATGIFSGAQGGNESLRCMFNYIRKVGAFKGELADKGLLYNDRADAMGWSIEHGHMGHSELLIRYFASPESAEAAKAVAEKSHEITLKEHYGVPHSVAGDALHDLFGPSSSNYNLWLRKIKKVFDPKGVSEASGYITAKRIIQHEI
jgi:glycolate oxidase